MLLKVLFAVAVVAKKKGERDELGDEGISLFWFRTIYPSLTVSPSFTIFHAYVSELTVGQAERLQRISLRCSYVLIKMNNRKNKKNKIRVNNSGLC